MTVSGQLVGSLRGKGYVKADRFGRVPLSGIAGQGKTMNEIGLAGRLVDALGLGGRLKLGKRSQGKTDMLKC
jgi:hypothetical protein